MGAQLAAEGSDKKLPDGIQIDPPAPQEHNEAPRAAVARAEWQDLLDQQGLKDPAKIQAAKAERLKKVKDLKKAAVQKEAWVNNPAKPGFAPESFVKGSIEGKVNDALKDKLSQIQQLGLPKAAIDTFKTAIVDHVYSFYVKNGNEENSTKEYVEKVLIPKATFLFENLDKIYKSGAYPFASTFDCLQKFSDFSGLNFAQGDNFSLGGLQNLMEADQYNALITNFKSALIPMHEAEQLDKALKSLPAKEAPVETPTQSSPEPIASYPPEKPQQSTSAEVQTPTKTEVQPTQAPEKPLSTPSEQPKAPATPQATPTAIPSSAPSASPTTAPAKPASEEIIAFTGIEKLDKLLNKFLKPLMPFLIKIGLMPDKAEVPKNLLSPKELEEAKELQGILEKEPYGFSKETLEKLLKDEKKFKTVLDAKHDQKVDWPTYLANHLDGQKINELKNNSSLTSEDITQRFLTEIPKPVAATTPGTQPAAAQAPTSRPNQTVSTSSNSAVQNPPA